MIYTHTPVLFVAWMAAGFEKVGRNRVVVGGDRIVIEIEMN